MNNSENVFSDDENSIDNDGDCLNSDQARQPLLGIREKAKKQIQRIKTISFLSNFFLRLSNSMLFLLLATGITFGFNALKPILLREGMFSNLCGDTTEPCDSQIERLNSIVQISIGLMQISKLFIGVSVDSFSVRTNLFFFGFLSFISLAFCGFLVKFRFFDEIFFFLSHISFFMISISGVGLQWTLQKYYIFVVPQKYNFLKGVTSTLFVAIWSLSSLVFLGFFLIYTYLNVDILIIFLVFAVLIGFHCLFVIITYKIPDSIIIQEVTQHQQEEIVEEVEEVVYNSLKNKLKRKVRNITKSFKYIFSLKMSIIVFWKMFTLLQCHFTFSTLYDQAFWGTNSKNEAVLYSNIYSISLPIGAVFFTLLSGIILHYINFSIIVLSIGNLVWSLLLIIGSIYYPPLFFAMYFVYNLTTDFSFCVAYQLNTNHFPKKYWGTMNSWVFTIAGLFSLLQILLNYMVYKYFSGSFMVMNIVLAGFAIFGHLILCIQFPMKEWLFTKKNE